MKEHKEEIGKRIKKIRISKGKTMKEFGEMFDPNASDSIVSRWERGISVPNNERLKRIAEIGDISIDELLYGEPLEEDNLYQYLVSIVHLYFQTNEQILRDKYDMDTQKINSLLQKSLNYISENYKTITFEEEDKKMKSFNHSDDDVTKHPYFHFREILTNGLLDNIKNFIQAENMSDNPTLNIYGIADYAAMDTVRKVESYIEYLEKNELPFDKEVSEEILSEIYKLSDSLKSIEKKIN